MMSLSELAERCERAVGPDVQLDAEIEVELQRPAHPDAKVFRIAKQPAAGAGRGRKWGILFQRRSYTKSLDAAAMLTPVGFHVTQAGECRFLTRGRFAVTVETWGLEQAEDGSDIHTTPTRRHGVAETFPLALCAAALRARAASADTLPKGQDAQQGLAGTESGAVPKADAQGHSDE